MSSPDAAPCLDPAASQMGHGTRRKLGVFERHFPAARRAGNILNSRNPRKPSFTTGTGTRKSQRSPGHPVPPD